MAFPAVNPLCISKDCFAAEGEILPPRYPWFMSLSYAGKEKHYTMSLFSACMISPINDVLVSDAKPELENAKKVPKTEAPRCSEKIGFRKIPTGSRRRNQKGPADRINPESGKI